MNVLLKLTFKEYLRNWWIIGYIALLSLIMSFIIIFASYVAAGVTPQFYGALGVTIYNAALMFISVAGLVTAALVVPTDKESGLLEWFFARPVLWRDYILARFMGLSTALALATLLSFIIIAWIAYILLGVGYFELLATYIAMLPLIFSLTAIGVFIGTVAANKAEALGVAFVVWFYMNFIHPLTIAFLSPFLEITPSEAFIINILSPVEASRVLAYLVTDPHLSYLNPTVSIYIWLDLGIFVYILPILILIIYIILPIIIVLFMKDII